MSKWKKSLETSEGTLEYMEIAGKDEQRGIVITSYSGMDAEVRIPVEIDGLPVRSLAKKTFLSRKHLRKVMLPDTLEEIGDWAFAYCSNLESIWIPKKKLKMGSHIFMECSKIGKIYGYLSEIRQDAGRRQSEERPAEEEQVAALLAASSVMLDAEYLMDIMEAGTEAWIRKWDARMSGIMDAEDSDGYTKMILCGEEDYGSNIDDFIRNKRKSKSRLALLRLHNPIGLSEEDAQKLKDYLLAHTKGCDSQEAWEVILGEHGHEQEYFEMFADMGGVNEENFDAILTDMTGEYAEMKAFLIRYKEEKMECGDFFDALSLDDL